MRITGLFAVDENGGMGKNNTIPWHIREDFLHFKATTMNQHVIMGSNTYYDLRDNYSKNGIVLPGRHIYVISRKDGDGNVPFTNSVEEVIAHLSKHKIQQCFLIGGAQLLTSNTDIITDIIVSKISGNFNCDVVLPIEFQENKNVKIKNCSFSVTTITEKENFRIIYASRSK